MRRDSVAGRFSSSAGMNTWAVIIVATPAAMAALNGTNSTLPQPIDRMLDKRQLEVRIGLCVAVPGKVLAARRHAFALQRRHDGGAEPGHFLRLFRQARDRR